jgi:hypothetical protein
LRREFDFVRDTAGNDQKRGGFFARSLSRLKSLGSHARCDIAAQREGKKDSANPQRLLKNPNPSERRVHGGASRTVHRHFDDKGLALLRNML